MEKKRIHRELNQGVGGNGSIRQTRLCAEFAGNDLSEHSSHRLRQRSSTFAGDDGPVNVAVLMQVLEENAAGPRGASLEPPSRWVPIKAVRK
jgi:hypothetical protein